MKRHLVSISAVLLLATGFTLQQYGTPYTFPKLSFFPPMPASATNPVTEEGAELGRHLFYDPILSSSKTISCSSCHKQEFAFSDSPNQFSQGHNGESTTRNALPLFNLAWYPAYFWDGRAGSLEEQAFHPVRDANEMNLKWPIAVERVKNSRFYRQKFRAAFGSQEIDSVLIAKSLGQFMRTLLSYRSKYDLVLAGNAQFSKDEYEGLVLVNDMTKGDCLHCHTTDADALGTTTKFSNNGLNNAKTPPQFADKGLGGYTGKPENLGQFKIPSLRNVGLTAPYMHDGRFTTLQQVLDFYSEGVEQSATIDSKMGHAHKKGVRLTKPEKEKIIAFLLTLSDSAFITDPQFSNPFQAR